MNTLDQMKKEGEAPSFLNDDGFAMLKASYLIVGETPRDAYRRVAKAAASYQADPKHWEDKFFDVMWKNWLCLASPVLSNLGSDRGLPISCNAIHVDDSLNSIFTKNHELAMLSKNGAGVAIYVGDVRGRGQSIQGNGVSEGVIPWCKTYDVTTAAVSQGSTRRGASAIYLPIDHPDVREFINIRKPTGDVNRRCLNTNHALTISNKWMQELIAGDNDKRELWQEILTTRVNTGEPYLFFTDNANDQNPQCYKANGLSVKTSNICTEIALHTDPLHSFVCCLSSCNLVKWDEWKNTDFIETSVRFLDAVIQEYIDKSEVIPGLEASRRSAIKGRAIGLGVLGWHSLLQTKLIAFDSFDAMKLNAIIFRTMRQQADKATAKLADELGEPAWCKGFNRRNTHCLAVAPTVSNSIISGNYSPGVEPLTANIFSDKTAKGTFIRKNVVLEKMLSQTGYDTAEIWKEINANNGSVRTLKCLSDDVKEVFLTAREINQHAIIKQAGQRQKFIDQAQSINLFFAANSDPKYIHQVHIAAWELGLKSLYYLRSEGVIRGDLASRSSEECKACEG